MSSTISSGSPSHLPGKGASKLKSGSKSLKPSAGKPAHLPGKGAESLKPGGPKKDGVSLSPELKDAIRGGGGSFQAPPGAPIQGGGGSFPAAPGGPIRGGGGSFEAPPGAPKQGGGVVDAGKIDDVISNLVGNFGR